MENYASNEETLDPLDWEEMRQLSHRIIDDSIDYLRDVRDRPVWQKVPNEVRTGYQIGAPRHPTAIQDVYDELKERLLPYSMGNIHPRFWMWYMGSSNYTGALGDFLAAILGSNLGGGDHAAALMDEQVVGWMKEIVGFPSSASATLVSGGSMANIIALTVARNVMAGYNVREQGLDPNFGNLVVYGSDQVHGCHQSAVELLGLGKKALHLLPTSPDCRLDLAALRDAIVDDRRRGLRPACVIANAGTVNTGTIDDLAGISRICRAEDLWMHVDGCIGALAAIAPVHGDRVSGLDLADSVALDPHKCLHAPFEVGCAVVRDARAHHGSFALTPEYLAAKHRGVAAGPWLCDLGPQTSRGFRALKVWMSLKEQGLEKFGRLIDQNIEQAQYLARRIESDPELELWGAPELDIVCFRYAPGEMSEAERGAINTEIMIRMQEEGSAAISDTTIHGRHFLRVAIVNHRTVRSDLDFLIDEVKRLGRHIRADTSTEVD